MIRQDKQSRDCVETREPCVDFPALVRMNFFHGQLISERDLKTEQTYFRERLRHMNRCLHGYGIICGLDVTALPTDPDCVTAPDPAEAALRDKLAAVDKRLEAIKAAMAAAADDDKRKLEEEFKALSAEREALLRELEKLGGEATATGPKPQGHCSDPPKPLLPVTIGCGAALDCDGNDVILTHPVTLDLAALLSPADRRRAESGEGAELWLRICHSECGIEPTRPWSLDSCATHSSCVDTRTREDVRFSVSTTAPEAEPCCETCCCSCGDACLVLARINVAPGKPLTAAAIDRSVRRALSRYDPVVITEVSWQHGATYTARSANRILGTREDEGGLTIRFSRPVHVSTLLPGVIEVWRVAGGRGVSGIVSGVEGEFVDLPASGFVDEVRYRDVTGETVQARDRIIVVVRGEFILDRCCQPVAAANVGGRVRMIEGSPEPIAAPDFKSVCRTPPGASAPWTSGHGGVFESWFYVSED